MSKQPAHPRAARPHRYASDAGAVSRLMPRVAQICACLVVVASSLALNAHADADWDVINRVVIEHGALSVDHSKSVQEITAAQAKGGFKASHGVGLFQNRIKTELAFDEFAAPGRRLFLTTRITTSPVIYIARELPQGACSYQLVLAHELQHQAYDLEVLRAMPAAIRHISQDVFTAEELERAAPNLAPTQNRYRNRFFQQFNYVYQSLAEMRHPVIDNPESYKRLSGLCNGELAQYLDARPAQKAVAKKGK